MITAHVNELGIVFRGHNPIDQPAAWWESLLDELKAHHIAGLHPRGKRMSVDVNSAGTIRAVVHFTETINPPAGTLLARLMTINNPCGADAQP
jgi:hypothetical protein